MDDIKSWLSSKTVWGGVIALTATVAQFFGFTLTGADQSSLSDAIIQIAQAGGAILAIYGRVVASKKIG